MREADGCLIRDDNLVQLQLRGSNAIVLATGKLWCLVTGNPSTGYLSHLPAKTANIDVIRSPRSYSASLLDCNRLSMPATVVRSPLLFWLLTTAVGQGKALDSLVRSARLETAARRSLPCYQSAAFSGIYRKAISEHHHPDLTHPLPSFRNLRSSKSIDFAAPS